MVAFGLGGTFATMSYIAPMLTDVSGYAPSSVTVVLALTSGLLDRRTRRTADRSELLVG